MNCKHIIRENFSISEVLLIIAVFCICCYEAVKLPVDRCPGEAGRRVLLYWIYSHGTLPTENEVETIMDGWGFSYALRPFLSSIISAALMKVVSIPKLICFYNGLTEKEDIMKLNLSSAFPEDSEPNIEVIVKMLNINFDRKMDLINDCGPLRVIHGSSTEFGITRSRTMYQNEMESSKCSRERTTV